MLNHKRLNPSYKSPLHLKVVRKKPPEYLSLKIPNVKKN